MRSSSACSISALRTDGVSRIAPRITWSRSPLRRSRSPAVLAPMPFAPGSPSRRVAAQRDEVRHLRRVDPVDLAHLVGPDLVRPLLARLLQQDRDVVVGALEHVAVGGEDQRLAAVLGLQRGERAHQVVGLQRLVAEHRPAQRLVQRRRALPLPRQVVGHLGPRGVVVRVGVGAIGRRLLAEAHDDGARLVLLDAPQGHVHRADERVDRPAFGALDRVGQREEAAVEQSGGVTQQERSGHGAKYGAPPCGRSPDSKSSRPPRARRSAPPTGTR